MTAESHPISRRSLLTLGATAAAGALVVPALGAAAASPASAAVAANGVCGTPLFAYNAIAGQSTYYELSGLVRTFEYDATFYSRLQTWWNFWYVNTPSSWRTPGQIWSLGTYVNRSDGCSSTSSLHNWGRAIDLTQIYVNTPATTQVFEGRQALWPTAGAARNQARKYYWATVASLHYHFQTVLTHLYSDQNGELHTDHVHADNGWSGSGNSNLDLSKEPQVEHIQASLRHIWGYPITVTKLWNTATADACAQALARIGGLSGTINSSQTNWLAFNRATLRFGSGRQTY